MHIFRIIISQIRHSFELKISVSSRVRNFPREKLHLPDEPPGDTLRFKINYISSDDAPPKRKLRKEYISNKSFKLRCLKLSKLQSKDFSDKH